MNRKEKRLVREKIISTLDSHCCNCKHEKAYYTKDPYCYEECPIGLKLQQLAAKLITDAEDVTANNPIKITKHRIADPQLKCGKWSDEEELYLFNHLNHYSIEHLAERLQRSVSSVYGKVHRYQKLNSANAC